MEHTAGCAVAVFMFPHGLTIGRALLHWSGAAVCQCGRGGAGRVGDFSRFLAHNSQQ
jgi:hypothetical protein